MNPKIKNKKIIIGKSPYCLECFEWCSLSEHHHLVGSHSNGWCHADVFGHYILYLLPTYLIGPIIVYNCSSQ